MTFEVVSVQAQPMLHVTRTATMAPGDIARAAGDGFASIGAFIGSAGIAPAGAPLALYREWDGTTMTIDIGYPVTPADAARATGEVMAGETPAGKALLAVHPGAYSGLQHTYDGMQAHIRESGLNATGVAWEVYVTDPVTTPEADLVTEVYMLLA